MRRPFRGDDMRPRPSFRTLCVTVGATILIAACTTAQRNNKVIQFCLYDTAGIDDLRSVMRSFADAQSMTFVDNSARTQAELRRIGLNSAPLPQGEPLINMGIYGHGGLGVTAGNLGLSGYQIALGFTEGGDATKGKRFADALVRQLDQRWELVEAPHPDERGASPLPNCGAGPAVRGSAP
jgi:hypothetical protein